MQEEEEEGESEPSVVPLFQDAFNEALVSVSALAAQRSKAIVLCVCVCVCDFLFVCVRRFWG